MRQKNKLDILQLAEQLSTSRLGELRHARALWGENHRHPSWEPHAASHSHTWGHACSATHSHSSATWGHAHTTCMQGFSSAQGKSNSGHAAALSQNCVLPVAAFQGSAPCLLNPHCDGPCTTFSTCSSTGAIVGVTQMWRRGLPPMPASVGVAVIAGSTTAVTKALSPAAMLALSTYWMVKIWVASSDAEKMESSAKAVRPELLPAVWRLQAMPSYQKEVSEQEESSEVELQYVSRHPLDNAASRVPGCTRHCVRSRRSLLTCRGRPHRQRPAGCPQRRIGQCVRPCCCRTQPPQPRCR